jgi:tripeptide aminopeptidase
LGLTDAHVDQHGYVYASLAANCDNLRKVAFLAHLDISFDYNSAGIKPMVHRNYAGGPITLAHGLILDPKENPRLEECRGDTIITSDGSTLLGADDKAGVVEIIEMLAFLLANPQIKRPQINICFTPDEEKGTGVDQINMAKIDADFGFTVDGGFCGEVNMENFDASSGKIIFRGVNYHPGQAKDKMVNAVRYAAMFVGMLPTQESPENTAGRQGFIHPTGIKGDTSEAVVSLLLRAFSRDEIDRLSKIIEEKAQLIRSQDARLSVNVEIKESYRNMAEIMRDHKDIGLFLEKAANHMNIKLDYVPIRGGTDGCRLSFMGLPCPNIFTGGLNYHSAMEWISLEKMVLTSAFLVALVQGMA